MLEEVTPLAVIAAVRYLDLLAVHIILNLMVPHSLPMRVIPVNSLQEHPKQRSGDAKSVGTRLFECTSVNFLSFVERGEQGKRTNAT